MSECRFLIAPNITDSKYLSSFHFYIFTEEFEVEDKVNCKRLVNLNFMRGGYGSAIGTNVLGRQGEYQL